MFDISWTEFLLIGVVALIVIGPKELPAVMRTMGQWTRKVRSMAADFQGQFQEAMREAEMADLKKQVDDMAHDIKSYDPLKDVRADVEAAGRDIQSSLDPKPALMTGAAEPAASEPAAIAALAQQDVVAAATGPVAPEAVESARPDTPVPAVAEASDAGGGEKEVVAAAIAPVAPEVAEQGAEGEGTRRAG
jgi:sec-independent protein translocase protein TatB